jgi:DNA-binding MarR family transcriptional regulator
MLAIKGLPSDTDPSVSALANRLRLRHHSTVELINRLVERGFAVRKQSQHDRRQVMVELTAAGEELLNQMQTDHQTELDDLAPTLLKEFSEILLHHAPEVQEEKPETPPAYRTATAAGSGSNGPQHSFHQDAHSSRQPETELDTEEQPA